MRSIKLFIILLILSNNTLANRSLDIVRDIVGFANSKDIAEIQGLKTDVAIRHLVYKYEEKPNDFYTPNLNKISIASASENYKETLERQEEIYNSYQFHIYLKGLFRNIDQEYKNNKYSDLKKKDLFSKRAINWLEEAITLNIQQNINPIERFILNNTIKDYWKGNIIQTSKNINKNLNKILDCNICKELNTEKTFNNMTDLLHKYTKVDKKFINTSLRKNTYKEALILIFIKKNNQETH